ncbi:PREDICTED: uncharacterized protein LOC108377138 [Rhagoletis zephyria]|uniref:uncharacterized protein LOC108377138 n=1 Tax=Rhagoletis zephyria TaxID=28612 RepID=UPI000811286E|nr:PREDICTED: uncharacterized protein LOC108377138 [Rhagoletis zephyria]
MDEFHFAPPAAAANGDPAIQTRHLILQNYLNSLRHFRNLAEKSFQVRPFYFDNYVLWQYFIQRSSMESERDLDIGNYSTSSLAFLKLELLNQILDRRRQILYWLFYLLLVSFCVFAYRHRNDSLSPGTSPSQSTGDSGHSFIYPSMRMWRRITLPLIQRFPRLTELYDESCLMQNPFFQGIDSLSCDPCSSVQSVLELTAVGSEDPSNTNNERNKSDDLSDVSNEFVPFVFKIKQDPIQLDDFYNIYVNNQEIFLRDAYRVHSTYRDVTNLEELFSKFNHSQHNEESIQPLEAHNLWRCNRMLPARLLRKLFASPTLRLPRTGIALERYMAIDTAQAPGYTLPDTECANVYVQQALGTRYIFLRPTSECRHLCRTLSLRLPQSFVLSYNWLYWKPISAPDPVADTFSITLIGSYC